MDKKLLIIISGIAIVILAVISTFLIIRSNEQMIVQGEIETKTIDLSSKIPGRVKEIKVEKGDKVKKGDVLVILDTPDISAKSEQSDAMLELAQARQLEVMNGARMEQKQIAYNMLIQEEANLELLEKTYNRLKRLNEDGVVPTQKLDEAAAKYKRSKKAVDSARSNLKMYQDGARYEEKLMAGAAVKRAKGTVKEVQSYLTENTIKAPISGEITDVTVEEGELVGAGYTIITIVDTSNNWVVLNLREDLLTKVSIGTEFDVKIPAVSNEKIKVKVNYIAPLGNYATWRATKVRGDFDLKTFEIHAKPIENNPKIRAGMTAVVDWNRVK